MKLTRAASYALRSVVHIARLQQSHKASKKKESRSDTVASHKIANELGIDVDRFLLKVLKPLVGAQILQSIKGPRGGYSLARPANEISVLEVIEAAEQSPIRGSAPMAREDTDTEVSERLDQICKQLAEQTRKQLSKIKISDLTSRE